MKKEKRSMQALLKKRQQDVFVGRDKYEILFRENILSDDENRSIIFNVYGQGGIGKTTLLRKFEHISKSNHYVCIWCDGQQNSILDVLERSFQQIREQGYYLKNFEKAYNTYNLRCRELTTDPEAPKGLAEFVGNLAKAGVRLGRHTPAGMVLDFVDEDGLAKGANSLTTSLISHLRRKLSEEDERLIQSPISELTTFFIKELWEVADERNVIFFFDVYEKTSSYLENWLLECLDGFYGELPVNIIINIAGRHGLDKNCWASYEEILTHIQLEAFTEEDIHKYLGRKGIIDEQIAKNILDVSKGLPLLVAMQATRHLSDPGQIKEPIDNAIDRTLKWIEDPTKRQIVISASLPRKLNQDILGVIVGKENAHDLFAWLKQMAFVGEQSSGWVYHEIVRPHMIHQKYMESPQEWSDIHKQLADFYKKCQDDLNIDEDQKLSNPTWESLSIEEIYHLLCHSAYRYLPMALNGFIDRWKSINTYDDQWAKAIQQAGKEIENEIIKDWGDLLSEADEMERICNRLLNSSYLEERSYYKVLGRRALVYMGLRQYLEAINDLEKLLEHEHEDVFLG